MTAKLEQEAYESDPEDWGSVSHYLLEREAYEGELEALRKMYKMVRHMDLAEKFGDIYFICGEGGEKDKNNLPKQIFICPAYGADWFQVYERT
jgi:hypothetical protein